MRNDDTELCGARFPSFETLLNDPMTRMAMHADGLTEQDLLAAPRIAYKAIRTRLARSQ